MLSALICWLQSNHKDDSVTLVNERNQANERILVCQVCRKVMANWNTTLNIKAKPSDTIKPPECCS